ncbi:MAG TPA: twin-arginine translocase TatA/TatE family subunit [Solirubrobacteraceae bacterium]|nr:twin-arginine translocase TatA/TatE family subunit [Solirubrobacteraceae bacterium]
MMGLDNPIHIAFLLIVLLLVFGAKRLPEMGHSLGTGLRGFKDAIGGEATHLPLGAHEQPQPQSQPVSVQPVQAANAQPPVAQQPTGPQSVATTGLRAARRPRGGRPRRSRRLSSDRVQIALEGLTWLLPSAASAMRSGSASSTT